MGGAVSGFCYIVAAVLTILTLRWLAPQDERH